jgi:hypothetical protein
MTTAVRPKWNTTLYYRKLYETLLTGIALGNANNTDSNMELLELAASNRLIYSEKSDYVPEKCDGCNKDRSLSFAFLRLQENGEKENTL